MLSVETGDCSVSALAGIRVSYSLFKDIITSSIVNSLDSSVETKNIPLFGKNVIFFVKILFCSVSLLRFVLPTGDKFKVIWLAVAVWFNERNAKYNDDDVTFLCPINHCEIAHSFWVIMSKRAARICKYRRLYIGHCDQPTNLMKDYHRDIKSIFRFAFYRLWYCRKLGLLVIFVSLSR